MVHRCRAKVSYLLNGLPPLFLSCVGHLAWDYYPDRYMSDVDYMMTPDQVQSSSKLTRIPQ